MALIKYSDANKTTANSYIDQTDATNLLADMPSSTAKTLFEASTEKDQLLIRATMRVDMFKYAGWLNDDTQRLKFPRSSLYNDEGILQDRAVVPQEVEKATLEIALFMLENDINATNPSINVKREKVSSLEVEYKDNQVINSANVMLTPYIKGLLSPYFKNTTKLGKN